MVHLPAVVRALNGEVTRLTGKKPSDAIKAKTLTQKPYSTVPGRPIYLKEQKIPSGVGVRYLYQPGELEGRWQPAGNRPCVVSWGTSARTLGDQAWQARVVLLAGWAAAWFCQGRTSGGANWHPVRLMGFSSVEQLIHLCSYSVTGMTACARKRCVFVTISQCVNLIFCDRALGVEGGEQKWRPVFRSESLYIVRVWCAFSRHSFSALGFFDVLSSRIEYIFGRKPTYSAMECPAHSSFILPSTFLFAALCRGCSAG